MENKELSEEEKRQLLLNVMLTRGYYTSSGLYEERKKKELEEWEKMYTNKKPEIGDVVHKKKSITKFKEREGVIVKIKGNSCLVHWDERPLPESEFFSNLNILKEPGDPKNLNLTKKFAVMCFGKPSLPMFYETIKEAKDEAERLLFKHQQPCYILEIVSLMEFNNVKVTEIKKSKSKHK